MPHPIPPTLQFFPAIGAVVGLWGAAFFWAASVLWSRQIAAAVSTLATVWLTGDARPRALGAARPVLCRPFTDRRVRPCTTVTLARVLPRRRAGGQHRCDARGRSCRAAKECARRAQHHGKAMLRACGRSSCAHAATGCPRSLLAGHSRPLSQTALEAVGGAPRYCGSSETAGSALMRSSASRCCCTSSWPRWRRLKVCTPASPAPPGQIHAPLHESLPACTGC